MVFGLAAAGCGPPPEPQPPPQEPAAVSVPVPPQPQDDPDAAPRLASSVCAGHAVDLLQAIASHKCAIDEEEADALRAELEKAAVQGEVGVVGAVEQVHETNSVAKIAIRNRTDRPMELPLLVHSEIDAFPASANHQSLLAPTVPWPDGFSFETGRMLRKIRLEPGGYARAQVTLSHYVLVPGKRVVCPPNAKCPTPMTAQLPLTRGTHAIELRTPLYATDPSLKAVLIVNVPGPCPQLTCPAGQQVIRGCPGGMRPPPDACPRQRCVPIGKTPPTCPRVP